MQKMIECKTVEILERVYFINKVFFVFAKRMNRLKKIGILNLCKNAG